MEQMNEQWPIKGWYDVRFSLIEGTYEWEKGFQWGTNNQNEEYLTKMRHKWLKGGISDTEMIIDCNEKWIIEAITGWMKWWKRCLDEWMNDLKIMIEWFKNEWIEMMNEWIRMIKMNELKWWKYDEIMTRCIMINESQCTMKVRRGVLF
jgi:hypothetical protein